MANVLYDKGRQGFLDGLISWSGDDIKCVLIDSALYAPNLSTDEFLAIIPVGARVATSANLAGKSSFAGIADAGDATMTSVPAGNPCEYVVIYQDTGDADTSRLIALIDTVSGLPITPTGGDIYVIWSEDLCKIFRL